MARSEALLALAAVTVLGGCDLVFGLDGDAEPCDVPSFADATPTDITPAEDFSFDWYETFGVVQVDGQHFEITPSDAMLKLIDIGPYSAKGLSLTPEGDALFYTINVEPLTLKGALRGDEGQMGVADADLVIGLKRLRFGDLTPIDVSAVARKIVFDQAPPVAIDDDRVRPADSFVLDHNVADGVGADPIVSGVNAKVFAVGVVGVSDEPADNAPLGFARRLGFIG